jgi:hypothetical protein
MAGDSESLDGHDASEKKPSDALPPVGSGDVVYPPMREVIPIMLALCMAMFLYALVSTTAAPLQIPIAPQYLTHSVSSTNSLTGPQHYRNYYPPDHRRIQLPRRRRLVR